MVRMYSASILSLDGLYVQISYTAPDYSYCISPPTPQHAHALELLKDHLHEGATVLDVGSGSGYLTACMAHMVCTCMAYCTLELHGTLWCTRTEACRLKTCYEQI